MHLRQSFFQNTLGLSIAIALTACAGEEITTVDSAQDVGVNEAGLHQPVYYVEFNDPQGIGTAGLQETRRAFTSAAQYKAYFGHLPPANIDFAAGEAVVFYSAGVKRTGGYDASIIDISYVGRMLFITTRLESPGQDCFVTQAFTKPYVLVKFKRPRPLPRYALFQRKDEVRDCSRAPSCDDIVCAEGQYCELQTIYCITTPCYPIPTCVDVNPCAAVLCAVGSQCEVQDGEPVCVPNTTFCGGIAGFPCPGAGSCIDNPNEECDPEHGGADCGGMCTCDVLGLCIEGYTWDSSPEVCGCVSVVTDPCATVRCAADTHCEAHDGSASCVSNGNQACGDNVCGEGMVCCNASCGICTPPNGACIQIACE